MNNAQQPPTGDHTPEPWIVEPGTLTISAPNFKGPHRPRVPVCYPQDTMNREANARRIVACVNACAGFDTQTLEDDPRLFAALFDEVDAQRDGEAAEQYRQPVQPTGGTGQTK